VRNRTSSSCSSTTATRAPCASTAT
jgi:hypothetical protein